MTEQEQRTLTLFETRTRQLILQYREASEQNRKLREEVDGRDREIAALKQRLDELERKFSDLKTSKMIQISSGENASAQKRIAKLIREVDKCINMLNV